MTKLRAGVVALLIGAGVTGLGYGIAGAGAGASGPTPLGPGLVTIDVGIEHSRFDVSAYRVRVGTLVRFVVTNHDPINHEFVVGDASVHAHHEHGTESSHPPVPGEVSVGPGERAVTVMRFDRAGHVTYACHLPGHLAYGMVGEIEVVPIAG
ncbi:MAG: hypothetical protein JJE46_15065 [Acidimicrobiia bacterium]|nr:hypothetical protein [Acidimicrobiia bacterium]